MNITCEKENKKTDISGEKLGKIGHKKNCK